MGRGALCAAPHLSAYHKINPAKFIVVFTFGYSAKQHMCGIPFRLECTPYPIIAALFMWYFVIQMLFLLNMS